MGFRSDVGDVRPFRGSVRSLLAGLAAICATAIAAILLWAKPLANHAPWQVGFLSMLASVAALLVLLPVLRQLNIIDIPNSRSSHLVPTVRGGGAALIAVALLAGLTGLVGNVPLYFPICLCFGIVGFADDIKSLPAVTRLILQTAASLFCAASAIHNRQMALGLTVVAIVVGAVWITSFVNVFNFMDGINGISCLEVMVVSGAWWYGSRGVGGSGIPTALCALTFGLALGFLPFNFPKARAFLGDAGSYLFGGLLASIALAAVAARADLWLLGGPMALYMTDVFVTMGRRWVSSDPLLRPHRRHTYQLLGAAGWSHRRTATYIATLNVLLAFCGFRAARSTRLPKSLPVLVAVALLGLYLATPRLVQFVNAAELTLRSAFKMVWTLLAALPKSASFLVLTDALIWSATLPSAAFLLRWSGARATVGSDELFLVSVVIAQFVIGACIGLYRARWRVGSFGEGTGLLLSTAVTALAVHAIAIEFGGITPAAPIVFVAAVLAVVLQATPRSVWRMKRDGEKWEDREGSRALIYGAGRLASVLLPALRDRTSNYVAVGLIDDDPAKRFRSIGDVRVLGRGENLRAVALRESATTVILCMPDSEPDVIRSIIEMVKQAGLQPVLPSMWSWPDGLESVAVQPIGSQPNGAATSSSLGELVS